MHMAKKGLMNKVIIQMVVSGKKKSVAEVMVNIDPIYTQCFKISQEQTTNMIETEPII